MKDVVRIESKRRKRAFLVEDICETNRREIIDTAERFGKDGKRVEEERNTSTDSENFEVCCYKQVKEDRMRSSKMYRKFTESSAEYMKRAYNNE